MLHSLERYKPELLSLMRIATALVFLWSTAQKPFAFPAPPIGALGTELLLFTGMLETSGGALVALGDHPRRGVSALG